MVFASSIWELSSTDDIDDGEERRCVRRGAGAAFLDTVTEEPGVAMGIDWD